MKWILITAIVFCLATNLSANTVNDVDSLKELIRETNNKNVMVEGYLSLADYYEDFKFDSAWYFCKQALNISIETNDKKAILDCYYDLLNLAEDYDTDSNLFYAQKYIDAAFDLGEAEYILEASEYLYYKYLEIGRADLSLKYAKLGLETSIEIQDSSEISNYFALMGYGATFLNQNGKAFTNYLQALKIAEAIQDTSMLHIIYSYIPYFYLLMELYEPSHEYFNKSLELTQVYNPEDSLSISTLHFQLGFTDLMMQNYYEFRDHMRLSKAYIEKNISDFDAVNTYNSYSYIYTKANMPDSAAHYYELAEKANKNLDVPLLDLRIEATKGSLLLIQGKYEESVAYLLMSLEHYLETETREPLLEISQDLSQAYLNLGDYKNAHFWLTKANAYKDSMQIDMLGGMIAEFEQEQFYELEIQKKDLQIELEKEQLESTKFKYRNRVRILIAVVIIILALAIIMYRVSQLIRKQNKNLNLQNELIKKQIKLLEENEKRLLELNATKDKFFSIIAHDLKNPLSSIIGLSSVFLDENREKDPAKMEKFISLMNQSAYYGFSLLENLLTWSRSQTGAIKPEYIKLSINEMVHNIITGFSGMTQKKNITFHVDAPNNTEVFADKNMLHTILRNLMHNAFKFSHENGHVYIKIRTEGKIAKIYVIDQGVGMSEDDIDKLFTLGENVKRRGTQNEPGTGLGLVLCKEFIEMNKGTLSISCRENKGCSFCFTLPLFEDVRNEET